MLIQVDHNSSEPITRQVVAQIKWLVVSGKLRPGAQLPSIRELARELQINPTTVTRIYAELAHAGVIVLRQGQGAFVAPAAGQPVLPRAEVRRRVSRLARAMLVEALRQGLSQSDVDRIVSEEFQRIRSETHVPGHVSVGH
ncbi:MAG TPA: GntR family transcriptional regulator [Planctomycetaceae bacterium]